METSSETPSFLNIKCDGFNSCEIEIEGNEKALSAAVATLLSDDSPETEKFRNIIMIAVMVVLSKNDPEFNLEEEKQ